MSGGVIGAARADARGAAAVDGMGTQALAAPGTGELNDAGANTLLALHALLLKRRDTATTDRETRIAEWEKHRDEQIAAEKEARVRAAEAENSHGGFLSDIVSVAKHAVGDVATLHFADAVDDVNRDCLQDPQFWKDMEAGAAEIGRWAALAGSVALAAASGGAAAPAAALAITALVLNAASVAEGDLHVLEKAGMSPETASWVAIGCSVGGGLATMGASGAAGANTAMARAADTSARVTAAGSGAAGVVRGGASIEVAHFHEVAMNAETDVKQAELSRARIIRHIERVIDELKSTYTSIAKQLETIHQSAQENANARM